MSDNGTLPQSSSSRHSCAPDNSQTGPNSYPTAMSFRVVISGMFGGLPPRGARPVLTICMSISKVLTSWVLLLELHEFSMIRDPSTCIVRSPSVMWGEEGKEREHLTACARETKPRMGRVHPQGRHSRLGTPEIYHYVC